MSFSFIQWLAHRLPPCIEITERISNSFDRPLRVRQRVELWIHLRICEFCRRYAKHLGVLEMGIRRLNEDSGHADNLESLSSSAREKMKLAILGHAR